MFKIIAKDTTTKARAGELATPHGILRTPMFFPVATQASVKTLSNEDVKSCGAQAILSNTYHLYLRPGIDILKKAGGLHRFMGWDMPILTDSGGYQVFSLATLMKVREDGVEFKSHLDGSKHFLRPENIIELQIGFSSDIIMPLDECVHYPAEKDYARSSLMLTTDWARRSKKQFANTIHHPPSTIHHPYFNSLYPPNLVPVNFRIYSNQCLLQCAETCNDGLNGRGVGDIAPVGYYGAGFINNRRLGGDGVDIGSQYLGDVNGVIRIDCFLEIAYNRLVVLVTTFSHNRNKDTVQKLAVKDRLKRGVVFAVLI